MKEIKQRKERRFLKTLGRVGEILVEQVLLKLGSSIIKKIGGKKTLPSILFLLASLGLFAQYPNTGNKQRLGFQTTGDGLVYRGRATDTVAIKSSGLNNAYFILDTVNNIQYNYIKTKGGWVFSNGDTIIINGVTMPFDSITFNTAKNGTVGVGEVEYNDTQGSLIQGLKGGNVTNVIGQQLHQRVNNRTGAPLAKGDVVYLAGSQGNRITVAKGLAVTDAFSANTFGVVAEAIANNASGFIITEGLITGLNTSALTEDSAVYLSPTVAGALTSTKPQAPQHSVYIGVCVKSNNGSGELFVKIRNGLEMDELHDTRITNPVTGATLYYSGGLWRDTTAALLVSDTASMLTNYLRTGVAASTYLTQSNAASTYLPLTGGTLTGALNGTNLNLSTGLDVNGNFTNNLNSNISALFRGYQIILAPNSDYQPTRIHFPNRPINFTFSNYGSGIRHKWGESDARNSFLSLYTSNPFNLQIDAVSINSSGDVGIKDTTPSFTLDVNGTLGVTGATTLSAPLTVNSSAVFNEGSTDSDFRVESDGNANMVFVDASTDRVGIGTNAPTRTLEVNGTVGVSSNVTANSFIKSGGSFTQFLKADGTVDGNDYLTTSSAGSTYYAKAGGTISGAVTLSTTTATPTSLLGKDGSNVVGTVTTVAQTGLMTRGETTTTTGSPSAIFTVTHGLGANPSSVIVTSAGIGGGNKILFEVYTKNSTTFSVQAWNLDGTEAASKEVKIYWLAIK